MKNILAITAFVAGFLLNATAQTPAPGFNYQMLYVSTGTVDAQHDSIYVRTCCVELPDTTSITKIIVKAGTQEEQYDVFNYGFIFDNTTGLPGLASYYREGTKTYLGLFNTTKTDMYHYEVILEFNNGTSTEPKYWY